MRYFAELAYNGANYSGWQKQDGQTSVQATIEEALSTILSIPVAVVGCGRTDSGVHARQYFLHFDFEGVFPPGFLRRTNRFLPPDIAIYRFFEVEPTAHARYDAFYRSYEYHLYFNKNPFTLQTSYYYPFAHKLDIKKMQQAAALLLAYEDFFPFCKSKNDLKSMKCRLHRSEWIYDEKKEKLIYQVAANRFLRGMVRLIVGMCLFVGRNKISIEEVKEAMDNRTYLRKSLSVPPQGLFLTEVRYPFKSQNRKI